MFPKIIKKTESYRIIWAGLDSLIVEMNAGKDALQQVQWKKPNQITLLSILSTYIVERLKIKYRDELIKEGIEVAPLKSKK